MDDKEKLEKIEKLILILKSVSQKGDPSMPNKVIEIKCDEMLTIIKE